MKDETEVIAGLISALETAHFEMLTLVPRLGGTFQSNLNEACKRAKSALADAKEFYDSKNEVKP